MFNKGNLVNMLKQAQSMQSKMADIQNELEHVIVEEHTADLVRVKMNGQLKILDIQLTQDAMREEKEVLEDILVTTLNKSIQKVQQEVQARMNAATGNLLGGLKIPEM